MRKRFANLGVLALAVVFVTLWWTSAGVMAAETSNPCNPCAANPCNPCNPCAANPCNPCAANPCNPCAANPCNPCAANPCNPCAAQSTGYGQADESYKNITDPAQW